MTAKALLQKVLSSFLYTIAWQPLSTRTRQWPHPSLIGTWHEFSVPNRCGVCFCLIVRTRNSELQYPTSLTAMNYVWMWSSTRTSETKMSKAAIPHEHHAGIAATDMSYPAWHASVWPTPAVYQTCMCNRRGHNCLLSCEACMHEQLRPMVLCWAFYRKARNNKEIYCKVATQWPKAIRMGNGLNWAWAITQYLDRTVG